MRSDPRHSLFNDDRLDCAQRLASGRGWHPASSRNSSPVSGHSNCQQVPCQPMYGVLPLLKSPNLRVGSSQMNCVQTDWTRSRPKHAEDASPKPTAPSNKTKRLEAIAAAMRSLCTPGHAEQAGVRAVLLRASSAPQPSTTHFARTSSLPSGSATKSKERSR